MKEKNSLSSVFFSPSFTNDSNLQSHNRSMFCYYFLLPCFEGEGKTFLFFPKNQKRRKIWTGKRHDQSEKNGLSKYEDNSIEIASSQSLMKVIFTLMVRIKGKRRKKRDFRSLKRTEKNIIAFFLR